MKLKISIKNRLSQTYNILVNRAHVVKTINMFLLSLMIMHFQLQTELRIWTHLFLKTLKIY